MKQVKNNQYYHKSFVFLFRKKKSWYCSMLQNIPKHGKPIVPIIFSSRGSILNTVILNKTSFT